MSGFFGIELGSRALRAFQLAMDVTGHNVANATTPGYTRQRLVIQPTPEYVLAPRLRVGTGVIAQNIQRLRDLLLEQRYNQATAGHSQLDALSQQLNQIESLFNEPSDQGLNQALTDFFNAFDELVTRPDSMAARQTVLQRAGAVANLFRSLDQNLTQLDDSLTEAALANIKEANNLAASVAELNQKIRIAVAAGESPNDLLDQRDTLINRLSTLVGARLHYAQDGTASVFVGEHTLVQADSFTPLPTELDVDNKALVGSNGLIHLSSGEVSGLLESVRLLRGYQSDLNTLASTLIQRVNEVHRAGYGLDGVNGRNFFDGTGASDIRLHSDISDPRALAASANGEPGNAGNAQALANLREEAQSGLGDLSFIQYYRNLVGRLGEETQTYKNSVDSQESIVEHLQNLRESVSGVSLDEEAANLVKYQRSYQAAAKLVSVFDSMIADLLQMV